MNNCRVDVGLMVESKVSALSKEASELAAIITAWQMASSRSLGK
jgi:hypothetical protein